MKLEAVGKPFIYRWPDGEVRLEPGKPVELSPERAAKLLARASGRVRQVDTQELVLIEPAMRPDGRPMKPVYWERLDSRITGPAAVGFFYRLGSTVGLIVDFEGQLLWVNADLLRSQRQFETQRPLQAVELVRELR